MINTISIQEIEISYKPKTFEGNGSIITSSKDAFNVAKNIFPSIYHVEYFYIILMNNANKVLGYSPISKGGLTATLVDVRIIFQTALKANATSMILAHNHPSGKLKESEADLKITQKIKQAGEVLDIKILDHIIIADEKYISFADESKL